MSGTGPILSQFTDRPNNLFALLYRYRVTIPVFQRHYVQGANNPKAEEVRSHFTEDLLKLESLHLHFIYGPINTEGEDSFTAVDGQQRLTTLWLLARYATEFLEDEEKNPILNLLSRFSYVGRMHAERFCSALTTKGNGWNPDISPDESIPLQPWFWDEWKQDETVDSMLRMLKTIHQKWKTTDPGNVIRFIAEKATFSLQIDSFADDIYMKMNARGLQLTQWENFKGRFAALIHNKDSINWNKRIEELSNLYFVKAGNQLPDIPFFALAARLLVYENRIHGEKVSEDQDEKVLLGQLVNLGTMALADWEDDIPFVAFDAFTKNLKEKGVDQFAESYLSFLDFILRDEISSLNSPYWDTERTLLATILEPQNQNEVDLSWLLFSYCRKNGTDVSIGDFPKALRCIWNVLENTWRDEDGVKRCAEFSKCFIENGGPTLYEVKQIPKGKDDIQWKEEFVKGGIYRSEDSELIEFMQKAESWMHGRVRLGILNMTSDEHEACICKKRLDRINSLFEAWNSEQSDWRQARKTITMNIVAAYPYWDDNFYKTAWNIPIANLYKRDLRDLLTSWWIDHLIQKHLCEIDTEKMLDSPIDKTGIPDADSPILDWRQILLNIATARDGDEFKIYQNDFWDYSRVAYYGKGHFIVLYKKHNITGSLPINDWRILLGSNKNEFGNWYRNNFFEKFPKECQQKYNPYDITCNYFETHSIVSEEKGFSFYLHKNSIGVVCWNENGKVHEEFIPVEMVGNSRECLQRLTIAVNAEFDKIKISHEDAKIHEDAKENKQRGF